MGSILNFIKLDKNIVIKNRYKNIIFGESVISHYISSPFFSKSKKDSKNLYYIECRQGIHNFYERDMITNKTLLDNVSSEVINSIKNEDSKILLTSISEASNFDEKIHDEIEQELKRFGIPNNKLIIIDSNILYEKNKIRFQSYSPQHFLTAFDNKLYNSNSDLKYKFEQITESDCKSNLNREKHFISLNRNSNKNHRHFLILFLYKTKIINKTLISVLRKLGFSNKDEFSYLNEYLEEFNKLVPLEIDTHDIKNKLSFRTDNALRKKDYLKSYINLVTETEFEGNILFFTEKIVKPIISYQPFIVLSNPYYLKELKSMGFKTFSSIIDESYDDEVNDDVRLQKIFNEIERISKLSLEDMADLYKSVLHICIYNRNHLEKLSKQDVLLKTFKQIEYEW